MDGWMKIDFADKLQGKRIITKGSARMQYQNKHKYTSMLCSCGLHTLLYTETLTELQYFLTNPVSSPQQTSDSNKASANTRLILIQDTFFFSVLTFPLVSNTIFLPISIIMDSKIKC